MAARTQQSGGPAQAGPAPRPWAAAMPRDLSAGALELLGPQAPAAELGLLRHLLPMSLFRYRAGQELWRHCSSA